MKSSPFLSGEKSNRHQIKWNYSLGFLLITSLFIAGCSLFTPYTVTYNANGATSGTAPIDSKTYITGVNITALPRGDLARTGYNFAGWTTPSDGSGLSCAPGATIEMGDSDFTLYAVWIPTNFKFQSVGPSIAITGYSGTPSGDLVVPAGVTTLSRYSFYPCTQLTSVSIPASVREIDTGAFNNCSGIKTITIANGLEAIHEQAFWGCTALTGIDFPSSVKTIGSQAFLDCISLTSLSFPSGIKEIGASSFSGCTNLDSFEFPSSITTIYSGAFASCTKLRSVTMKSTTPPNIQSRVFTSCPNLQIHVPAGSLSKYQIAWSEWQSKIVSP